MALLCICCQLLCARCCFCNRHFCSCKWVNRSYFEYNSIKLLFHRVGNGCWPWSSRTYWNANWLYHNKFILGYRDFRQDCKYCRDREDHCRDENTSYFYQLGFCDCSGLAHNTQRKRWLSAFSMAGI